MSISCRSIFRQHSVKPNGHSPLGNEIERDWTPEEETVKRCLLLTRMLHSKRSWLLLKWRTQDKSLKRKLSMSWPKGRKCSTERRPLQTSEDEKTLCSSFARFRAIQLTSFYVMPFQKSKIKIYIKEQIKFDIF